jgi:hypothetical protein
MDVLFEVLLVMLLAWMVGGALCAMERARIAIARETWRRSLRK